MVGKGGQTALPARSARRKARRRIERSILTLAADKEVRIARDEIEILQPGKVSIMPAGLDKQLTLQELSDLVEFLRNCK